MGTFLTRVDIGDEKAAPTRAIRFILEGGKKLKRKFWFACVMANLKSTGPLVVGRFDKYIESEGRPLASPRGVVVRDETLRRDHT